MICRWCGAKTDPKLKSCQVCGRENLPLSDCGGFPGLVSRLSANETAVSSPKDVHRTEAAAKVAPPSGGEAAQGSSPRRSRRKRKDKRRSGRSAVLGSLAALILVLVLLGCILAELKSFHREWNEWKDDPSPSPRVETRFQAPTPSPASSPAPSLSSPSPST